MRLKKNALPAATASLALSVAALLTLLSTSSTEVSKSVAVFAFAVAIPVLSLCAFLNLGLEKNNMDSTGISVYAFFIGALSACTGLAAMINIMSTPAAATFVIFSVGCLIFAGHVPNK